MYDSGLDDGTKNTNWVTSGNPTITPSSTGTFISATSSATYRNNALFSGDFVTTFEVTYVNPNGGVRAGFTNPSTSHTTRWNIYSSNMKYVEMKRENGVFSAKWSSNGETWSNITVDGSPTLTDEDCMFYFYIYTSNGQERSLTYKNLRILPL